MTTLDICIILLYILALFVVGVSVGVRENADDFLILSRRANVWLVMFSVVSGWVGVGVIAGTASAAYRTGISFALTGAVGALVAVIAAGFFAPIVKRFGDRFRAHTIGDFFGLRYSPSARALAALTVSAVYLLFTAVQFNGLARLLTVWTDVAFGRAVFLAAIAAIAYTAFAGIKSDFYTDAVHFVVMVLVLVGVLVPMLWRTTDHLQALRALPKSFFAPFSFGGPAYFIGGIVFGVGVVLVSMELWQRIYASTSQQSARVALIGSALAIVPFYLVAALAGMALRVGTPNLADPDSALFVVMKQFLPAGVLGLGVAALIAAFISAANTMIMVVSATLTKDLYRGFIRPNADDAEMLRVGRATTLIAGVAGLALSYLIRDIVTLSVIALFILLVFLPGVVGGFFWRRSTASGAFWSIASGLLATFVGLPYLKTNAFIPALAMASIVFVAVSIFTSHSTSETVISVSEL